MCLYKILAPLLNTGIVQNTTDHILVDFVLIYFSVSYKSSIKSELHRYEATKRSTVLTTKELLSLLDNHVSITEMALEMTDK